MANPILVEITRGSLVESVHRGAIAIVDSAGRPRCAIGDVEAPVFPRSAVKALQAIPLVESGAADRFGFRQAELALASASHTGEPRHVDGVGAMLAAAGRGVADLECGTHMPSSSTAQRALIRAGTPASPLHNNCSGKHAGFICLACHMGVSPQDYVLPEHPIQREVTAVLAEMTGAKLDGANRAVDGCSIPAYAIPLDRLALAFARFITGDGLSTGRALAARRIADACMSEPFMVAGSGRFCTEVMTLFGRRVFAKTGAEGVFCGALPDLGLGIALKCDDGATRASETMMAAVIAALVPMSPSEDAGLAHWLMPSVTSRRGAKVGEIRPVAGLTHWIREGSAEN